MSIPAVDRIHFGNNSVIKLPNGLVVNGTSGNDWFVGSTGSDMMIGGKGDDTYIVNHVGDRPVEEGAEGVDHVRTSLLSYTLAGSLEKLTFAGTGNFAGYGNSLNNTITGGAGNDWLDGGTGNDVLTGGEGADSYWYERGDGNDTIYNWDSGGADRVVFAAGIAENQLWFAQNGGDLLVTLRGTGSSDTIRMKSWYTDSANRLSTFKLSDGSVLDASRVQQLVQAMAKFTSSSGAPMSLSGTQSQTVEAVIAANWQSS